MLTALLFAFVQTQSKEADAFVALGRARADFGEKWIEPNGYEAWIWNSHRMVFEGSTTMLFVEGEHDRRLYLQRFSVDDDGDGEYEDCYWLVQQTRHRHKTSTETEISFDWKIKLESSRENAAQRSGIGTLELMLEKAGLRVPSRVPEPAERIMTMIKGFAAYVIQPKPGTMTFSYWYVRRDGTTADYVRSYEPPRPEYTDEFGTPVTDFPYPVTQSERDSLAKQGKFWASRDN
jgi:hypothetical protein